MTQYSLTVTSAGGAVVISGVTLESPKDILPEIGTILSRKGIVPPFVLNITVSQNLSKSTKKKNRIEDSARQLKAHPEKAETASKYLEWQMAVETGRLTALREPMMYQ